MHIGISAIHVRPGQSGSHEPYMVNLVRALTDLACSHTFSIFGTAANRHLFDRNLSHVRFVAFPGMCERVLPRIFFEQFILPFEARRRGIDVLHYGGTAGSCFVGARDVVTIHHDSTSQRASMSAVRNFYFDIVLRLNRRAGLLIVPSKTYADEMSIYYGYQRSQLRPVHHGAHPSFIPQSPEAIGAAKIKWGIEDNAILSVTNSLPHKNLHNLVAGFHCLGKDFGVRAQLVLVGKIELAALDKIFSEISASDSELRGRVRVIPYLPNEELPAIYGAASMLAFLSFAETFGIPLTEAMGCGIPVLASDIPVHREILQKAGYFAKPDDVRQIASGMHTLLTNSEVREEFRVASVGRGRCFSWNQSARHTLAVYEEAAGLGEIREERRPIDIR